MDDANLPDTRLLLLAQEADEVPLISALVQDAILRPADVAYDRRARRLVLLLDRYRWEANDRTRVQLRGWTDFGAHDPGITILELLAFIIEDDVLTIAFAAGPTLRVSTECVDIILEDLSPPWRATRKPEHR